ncbi:hypothetical protein ACFOD4_09605 [Pseudoroseomonas globiformis]|uniref:Uncharacterized protein n=1 Tax=Teichococcus globiformis TaxID=2307229 RepID=A0ABV7G195_9PROT
MKLRNAMLPALLLIGLAGGAAAAESGIEVVRMGENFAVDYSNDGGNILGGGPVQVIGRGENARYLYAPGTPAQHDAVASFAGQGENGDIVYTPVQPRG